MEEKKTRFYKVTNLAKEPCNFTWNRALLPEVHQEEYRAYQETEDFVGRTPADRAIKKKVPSAVKMRPFYDELGLGVRFKVYDNTKEGVKVRHEWRFTIGPNVKALVEDKERGLIEARRICEKYGVKFEIDEKVDDLAKKLTRKFGDNVKILTDTQWLESGLRNLERKEIKLKLKPGESEPRIRNKGYLKAEPMTEVEVEEFKKKKSPKKK